MNSKDNIPTKLPSTVNLVPSSSSVDSSPVSSSSSSYNNPSQQQQANKSLSRDNNLINLDPLADKIDSIKALSRDLTHQVVINNNDIFKYPSDNEYMYSQENQQRRPSNSTVSATTMPIAYKQSDFYYTQKPHPTHAYFQQQQQMQQQPLIRAQTNSTSNAQIQTSRTNGATSSATNGTKNRYINPSIETPI